MNSYSTYIGLPRPVRQPDLCRVQEILAPLPYRVRVEPATGTDNAICVTVRDGWLTAPWDEERIKAAVTDAATLIMGSLHDTAPPKRQGRGLVVPALDMPRYFGKCLDCEAPIRVIYDAIRAADDSGFTDRNHAIMFGPPACGKSRVLRGFADMLGDAFWHITAPAVTAAGLEREFLRLAMAHKLPPVIGIEEVEKGKTAGLSCLLTVMDESGVIQRTNARDGDVRAEARCLVIATCNSTEKLAKKLDGALWSRFGLRVPFGSPGEVKLRAILLQHIQTIGGHEAWADIVIRFMMDVLGTDDPRVGKALLTGRDRLEDGSYLADMAKLYGGKS